MYNRSARPAAAPKPTIFNYGKYDPLARLAAKVLVQPEDVDRISFAVLTALDACRKSLALM